MMKRQAACVIAGAVWVASSAALWAHCQVPCGIYDDQARLAGMREQVTTIEKAMKNVTALSAEKTPNYNQIVRWVSNKEEHARKLMDIVTAYFMVQRIKPPAEGDKKATVKYNNQPGLLHRILVSAMKCKQTTDLAHAVSLRKLIREFEHSYPGDAHKH